MHTATVFNPERWHRLRRQVRAFGSSRRPSTGVPFPTSLLRLNIRRAIKSTPSPRRLSALIVLPIQRAFTSPVKEPLLSSPSESEPRPTVTRIVASAPRRLLPSLPLLTPHCQPRGAAHASPRRRTRQLIVQVPTLPSLLAFASRTIRRSGPDLPASIRGEREGTTGGQFGLDGLNACGRNVLQPYIPTL